MTSEEEFRRRLDRRRFDRLIARSSIGTSAWIDCPRHGHQVRDPDTDRCIRCSE